MTYFHISGFTSRRTAPFTNPSFPAAVSRVIFPADRRIFGIEFQYFTRQTTIVGNAKYKVTNAKGKMSEIPCIWVAVSILKFAFFNFQFAIPYGTVPLVMY